MNEARETAGAIATLSHFASVGIDNPVAELDIRPGRCFDQKQLIKADAEMSIGKSAYRLRRQVDGLVYCVYHHEVITETVHFGKGNFHALRVRAAAIFASKGRTTDNSPHVSRFRLCFQREISASLPVNDRLTNHAPVMRVRDVDYLKLSQLLARYGLNCEQVEGDRAIPGSFWGESEAGLVADRLVLRADTPVHSVLHEACHFVCMTAERRGGLHTDAGGDYDEENAVCYLQILLADCLPGVGRRRLMQDMDSWGYSFRLGAAQAWFERDADDARSWLMAHRLINASDKPTWRLRHGEQP